MFRQLVIFFVLCNTFFCQQVYAISAIKIQIGEVDAPAGKLRNAQFQVDLKGSEPTLVLKAEVKPINEKEFIPFSLQCTQFNTEKI
jgi:hypothetical protein